MGNKSQTIVISKYNCSYIKSELQKTNVSINIKKHKFDANKSIIIYEGYEFFFKRFIDSINEDTDIDPDTVFKKGDKSAPGMYKLGSLNNKNYKSLFFI